MTGGPVAQQAVVLGASAAGLLAAAALAGPGRSVLVLERDPAPTGIGPRAGVPQSPQPHVYLYRGLSEIEALLPGFAADLRSAGAVAFDTGTLCWLSEQGWFPQRPSYEVLSLTRPLFEHVLRDRVTALPGVEIRGGTTVHGVTHGVGWTVRTDTGDVRADLVVDASGRSSRLSGWLAELGVDVPPATVVDARLGYASRLYQAPAELADFPGIVLTATPDEPTGGMALPVEDGRWMVALVGMGDGRPGRDPAQFDAFVAGLREPALARFIARCAPLGEVAIHRQTANRRQHYGGTGWPAGLLVIGDSLCAFDPIYGQGIAVAAIQAGALRRWAGTAGSIDAVTPTATRMIQRRFRRAGDVAWSIATGQDLRYPTSSGGLSGVQRVTDRWSREIALLGVHGNSRAIDILGRVYHLMGSPVAVLHPRLLLAAARHRVRGLPPATPRPRILQQLDAGPPRVGVL